MTSNEVISNLENKAFHSSFREVSYHGKLIAIERIIIQSGWT
jgi:hypothetical protein